MIVVVPIAKELVRMPDNNEEWRPVRGYEGIYSVSSMGNVRSESRTVPHPRCGTLRTKRKMMRLSENNRGYKMVWLTLSKKRSLRLVHRLVVEAFRGPIAIGMEVNHRNGVKADNRIANLEVVTRSENLLHAHATGLSTQHGETHHNAKLTHADVDAIRAMSASMTQAALASMFGANQSSISRILSGITWRHGGPIADASREGSTASPSSEAPRPA